MKALAAAALALCACATSPSASPETATRQHPPLEGPVTKGGLPSALDVDPKAIAIAPLTLEVKAPTVVPLENGLTVYLVESHQSPLVSVRVLVPTGGFDDPSAQVGLADLTADLVVTGGAGSRTAAQVDELLESLAADASGSSADEYSVVGLTLRSADLERVLPVLADMVQRPRFDAARFEVSKNRLLEGIRRRVDRPEGLAARAVAKAVYGAASPLARESTATTVKAITAEVVKAHHAKVWGPRGAKLVVSGDVTADGLLALVKQQFGGWKGGAPVARAPISQPPLARRVVFVPKEVPQAKIRLAGPGFSRRAPNEYPLRLAASALGSFGVGRLYKEIRDRRGLSYSAWAQVSPGPTIGLFQMGFDTRADRAVEALAAALEVLDAARGPSPIADEERARGVDMATNSFAFRFDHPSKIAFERAVFDLFEYPPDYLSGFRERMAKTPLAELQGELAKSIDPATLQIIVVGPASLAPALEKFGPVKRVDDVEKFD